LKANNKNLCYVANAFTQEFRSPGSVLTYLTQKLL